MKWFVGLMLLALWSVASADDNTYQYTTSYKNDNQSTAQSATTLWTPASGYRIVLQGCAVSSGTAQTTTFLFNTTTVIPIIYTAANGNALISAGSAPIGIGAADAVLKYTTTAAVATSVSCWGYERKF